MLYRQTLLANVTRVECCRCHTHTLHTTHIRLSSHFAGIGKSRRAFAYIMRAQHTQAHSTVYCTRAQIYCKSSLTQIGARDLRAVCFCTYAHALRETTISISNASRAARHAARMQLTHNSRTTQRIPDAAHTVDTHTKRTKHRECFVI